MARAALLPPDLVCGIIFEVLEDMPALTLPQLRSAIGSRLPKRVLLRPYIDELTEAGHIVTATNDDNQLCVALPDATPCLKGEGLMQAVNAIPVHECLNCGVQALKVTKHLCAKCYDYQRRHGGAARPVVGREPEPEPLRDDAPVFRNCQHMTVRYANDPTFPFICIECDTRLTRGVVPETAIIQEEMPTQPEAQGVQPEEEPYILVAHQEQGVTAVNVNDYKPAPAQAVIEASAESLPERTPAVQFLYNLMAQGEQAVREAVEQGRVLVPECQPRPARVVMGQKVKPGTWTTVVAALSEEVRAMMRASHAAGMSHAKIDALHGIDAAASKGRVSWLVCKAVA